jgi:hypothetical protein
MSTLRGYLHQRNARFRAWAETVHIDENDFLQQRRIRGRWHWREGGPLDWQVGLRLVMLCGTCNRKYEQALKLPLETAERPEIRQHLEQHLLKAEEGLARKCVHLYVLLVEEDPPAVKALVEMLALDMELAP